MYVILYFLLKFNKHVYIKQPKNYTQHNIHDDTYIVPLSTLHKLKLILYNHSYLYHYILF